MRRNITSLLLLSGVLFSLLALPRHLFLRGEPPQRTAKNTAASAPSSTAPYPGACQLPTALATVADLALPPDLANSATDLARSPATSTRQVPPLVTLAELTAPRLESQAVPLPQADTLSQRHFEARWLGRLQTADGSIHWFNPETVLVKFRDSRHVAALRVSPGTELQAARILASRSDVRFAELDVFQKRAAFPNDPLLASQWHHQTLGSQQAWAMNTGQSFVRLAIVDTPFQMNHPDLPTAAGWDVDQNAALTNSAGIDHSTLAAGLAAAVINNGLGVAGMGNCTVVPISINGSLSDMYAAVIWAADHNIRVVNISWTGGDSDTLNAAGAYLAAARGILVMAGGNLGTAAYTTNQPDICCIAMTDAADNMRSLAGVQVDFAAPGWQVYATTSGSGYGVATGTSYAAPVFAGVVAVLLSINPTLPPDEVLSILKTTADQPNGWPPGWNQYYGWGRIQFAAAAAAAEATRPQITSLVWGQTQARLTTDYRTDVAYTLWRTPNLAGTWLPVTNATLTPNGSQLILTDPAPPDTNAFYRIQIALP